MKKIFTILIVILPITLFSQIEVLDYTVKFYPNGTRISYIELSDYPIDKDFLKEANDLVLKDLRVFRFNLYENGNTCFIESDDKYKDDMLLEVLNEAYESYYSKPYAKNYKSISKSNSNTTKDISKKNIDITLTEEVGNSARSFKKYGYDGTYYKAVFKLSNHSDLQMIKNATLVLKEQSKLEEVLITQDIHFEIISLEPINADNIISIFEEFGLKIEDEFIK